MNLLVDALPSSVAIGGKKHKIYTDFKTCLRVILAFEDSTLTNYEKQIILLASLYPSMPEDTRGAIEQAVIFLNGGKASEESDSPRLYSFSKDANLIYAAFKQTHGIDLQKASLHWWQFLALFMDLGSDTTFCNLVSLRKRVKSGKATKEERRAASELGDMFDISEIDDRTIEDQELERQLREANERYLELIHGKS